MPYAAAQTGRRIYHAAVAWLFVAAEENDEGREGGEVERGRKREERADGKEVEEWKKRERRGDRREGKRRVKRGIVGKRGRVKGRKEERDVNKHK